MSPQQHTVWWTCDLWDQLAGTRCPCGPGPVSEWECNLFSQLSLLYLSLYLNWPGSELLSWHFKVISRHLLVLYCRFYLWEFEGIISKNMLEAMLTLQHHAAMTKSTLEDLNNYYLYDTTSFWAFLFLGIIILVGPPWENSLIENSIKIWHFQTTGSLITRCLVGCRQFKVSI